MKMGECEIQNKDFSIYKGTSKNMEIIFYLKDEKSDEHCHRHHHHHCPYIMDEEDVLILQVLDYRHKDKVVLEKKCKGDNFFSFIPSDTSKLSVGYYRYNVKFKPANSDNVYEVIAPSLFHIKAGE